MQRAPTRSQLRAAQRKKIPHHFLGDDFAKNQSVLEHSDLYRKRAQENVTRYGSSRAPPHQPSSFLDLPVEVLSGICNSLDITEREDIDALAALAQTCQSMKNIVTDKTRMRTSFHVYSPLQSRLLQELYDWSSLHHARKLVRHTEVYQEYITEQIVPHMKTMDGLTDAQPTDVPHDGFRTLLWAGELVRSKIMGLEVTPAPRTGVVQSLTPTELLVLMYSMVIFQGCYDLQFDEERADYVDAAGSGFHYLKALRIAFMMGGPQAALNMRNGVRGHFERFPNLMMKPENVFKYITLPSAARWENRLGDKAPEWCVRRLIEIHVKRWYRDSALQGDSAFEGLGIDQKGAKTIRACLKLWAEEQDPDRLPWNWEEV